MAIHNELTLEKFAQILATENISLQFDDHASTGSFNLQNRTITMPTYSWMDADAQIMMVVHETAHALFSETDINDFKRVTRSYGRSIANIVEDIYVEKHMLRRFPGIKTTMINGYKTLFDNGMFGDSQFSDIRNRINVYFKSRFSVQCQFNAEEKKLIANLVRMETREDAENCMKMLKELSEKERLFPENENPDENEMQGVSENNQNTEDVDESNETSDETEREDNENVEDEEVSDAEKNVPTKENVENGENDENEDITDGDIEDFDSETEFDKNIAKMNETITNSTKIFDIDKTAGMDFNDISRSYGYMIENVLRSKGRTIGKRLNLMAEICRKSSRAANTYFEQLKSSINRKEAKNKITGIINPRALYKYKLSDNPAIFKTMTINRNEQNHGVVILIDCSGSIVDVSQQIILNATTLAEFCYNQKIPFEVIAFGASGLRVANTNKFSWSNSYVFSVCNNTNYRPERILLLAPVFHKYTGIQFNQTPLPAGLLLAIDVLKKFIQNNVKSSHMIIVTDGYPSDECGLLQRTDETELYNSVTRLFGSVERAIAKNQNMQLRLDKIDIFKPIIENFRTMLRSMNNHQSPRLNSYSAASYICMAALFNYIRTKLNTQIHINFISNDFLRWKGYKKEDIKEEISNYGENYSRLPLSFLQGSIKNINIDDLLDKGNAFLEDIPFVDSYSVTMPSILRNEDVRKIMANDPTRYMKTIPGALKQFSIFIAKKIA